MPIDFSNATGADSREVRDATHDGRDVRVVVASRVYPATPEDLWGALTDAGRIARWFLPITGTLEPGGRYQLEGNAGGSILKCDAPERLELTWEFGGQVSWVHVGLAPEGPRGDATRLTLEHRMPKDEATETHWKQYGPGATGVGWDLSFVGLALHLASGGGTVDPAESQAWLGSDGGKEFVRSSASLWGEAHVRSGEPPEAAAAMAQRTADFYAG